MKRAETLSVVVPVFKEKGNTPAFQCRPKFILNEERTRVPLPDQRYAE